jgi:hypothetical protein
MGITHFDQARRRELEVGHLHADGDRPRSNELNFGGVKVIARLEKLDYWDGDD